MKNKPSSKYDIVSNSYSDFNSYLFVNEPPDSPTHRHFPPFSPIRQLDGMDDSLSPHTLTTQPTSRGFAKTGRAFSVPANISVAPYKLNERRQVNKLRQDSQLIDFEITVSPAEQSVSILCSTGSYSLVAVPVFAQTYVGSTQQVGDISIYCYDITGKVDTSGASVTAVIY